VVVINAAVRVGLVAGALTMAPARAGAVGAARARPADTATGIGATLATWDAHHRVAGPCQGSPCWAVTYNARGGLPNKVCNGVVYCGVQVTFSPAPFINGYSMQFPAGTTLARARAYVRAQLPPGARTRWYWVPHPGRFNSCTEMGMTSARLGRVLPAGLGGGVRVVLWWAHAGKRRQVDGAGFQLQTPPPKKPSCDVVPQG
jgi:hypothetical protein